MNNSNEATRLVCLEAAQKLRTYVGIYTGDKQARRLVDELSNIASALATSAAPEPEVQAAEAKLYRDLTGDAMALGYDGVPAALEALRGAAPSSGESADEDRAEQAYFDRWPDNPAPAAHSSVPSEWRDLPMPADIEGDLANAIMDAPCNWKGDPSLHSAILMGHTMACEQGAVLAMKYLAAVAQPIAASTPSELHEAAAAFLADIDAHDFGGIPEGPEADRLRAALAAPAPTGESLSVPVGWSMKMHEDGWIFFKRPDAMRATIAPGEDLGSHGDTLHMLMKALIAAPTGTSK